MDATERLRSIVEAVSPEEIQREDDELAREYAANYDGPQDDEEAWSGGFADNH